MFRRAYVSSINRFIYRDPLQYKKIPVVINNYNRYASLKKLVSWLEHNGYENIYILDNGSTYPPLLDWYGQCRHKVVRLKNLGHLALWKIPLFKRIRWNYFVYTDADVVPREECPHDVLGFFLQKLMQYPELDKIGFGLALDDLPDHYRLKTEVIAWERRYWEKEVEPGIYDAIIDTTFALYRPFTSPKEDQAWDMRAFRTDTPYIARHLPWYQDTSNFDEEEQYYIRTASHISTWTEQLKK